MYRWSVKQQRTILVTGVTSGIGEAIAQALLQAGHYVVGVASRNDCSLIENENFIYERIDLSDLSALPEKLNGLVKRYPNINGLVCNAGRGQYGSLEEFSYRQINELVELNFTSQVYVVRAFLPMLKRQGQGDVILMGSEAALSGGRRGALYSATKFAVRGFAQALRDEVSKNNVRVTVINPGMVKTPFFDTLSFEPGADESQYILPEDVAKVVCFVMDARAGTVFDEINLSPQKKVLRFKG